jgi:hypothetical protein
MMRTQEQYIINGPLCRKLLSLQFPGAMGIAYQRTGVFFVLVWRDLAGLWARSLFWCGLRLLAGSGMDSR